jgi:cbb3-type cytochrome c oxidase subunit III
MLDRRIRATQGCDPERRLKPGMDGGLRAAVLVSLSPLLHLRTADFLSKRWGPPQKAGAADLTSDVVQRQGDSELATIVKDGKGKMPAAGKSLSDEEIHALITYVRQLAKKP